MSKRVMVSIMANAWDDRALVKSTSGEWLVPDADHIDMTDIMAFLRQAMEDYIKERATKS